MRLVESQVSPRGQIVPSKFGVRIHSTPLIAAAVLVAAVVSPLPAQLLRARDVDSLSSKPADAREPYGTDSLQFGDLRLPKGNGPFPVVIVVHGGCWVARYASLRGTTALADALRDAGVATWNLEYRRSDSPGGGWPGTFGDVADGADHVRVLARKYPLDLRRVVATGHSAGAHLAFWLAARKRLPGTSPVYRKDPLPLIGIVPLAGPPDLAEFAARDHPCGREVVAQLMGGSRDQFPDRYAQGSPIELFPLGVPQIVIAGDRDGIMPAAPLDAYLTAARRSGDKAEVIVVPNAGHFEVIAPTSAAWPVVRDAILKLAKAARRS